MDNTIQNYRVKVAAKMVGIGKSTLWSYIKQGKIKAKKLSPRVTVIEEKELQRYMNSIVTL